MKSAKFLISASVALWITIIINPSAHAVSVYAAATESCGTWTAESNGLPRHLRVAWLLGFVSGYNWGTRQGEDVTSDTQGLIVWVDNYCMAHPLDLIAKAAGRLIDELRHQRGLPPTMRPN